ncbi:MAG: hypothetical protein MR368_05620 [Azospirillum sp.]|nr:hypothetical protein [Azospirillum sp.]
MKTLLINVGMLLGLVLMYYTDFWSLFTFKNAFLYSLILVAILLLIGLKVFGNPFRQGKDND